MAFKTNTRRNYLNRAVPLAKATEEEKIFVPSDPESNPVAGFFACPDSKESQESTDTTEVVKKEWQAEPNHESRTTPPVAPSGDSADRPISAFEADAATGFEDAPVGDPSAAAQSTVTALTTVGLSTDEEHDEAVAEGDAQAVSIKEHSTPIYARHPIAEDFARFRKDFDAVNDPISADIRDNGQRVPMVKFQGMLLDGWHRYCVCLKFGLPMKFIEYTGENPLGEFMSLNRHREHFTPAQLAAIIVRHVDLASMAAHGGLRGQAATLPLDTIASRARQAGVSPRTLARAVKVARANPATLDRVITKELSLVKAEALEYPKVVESDLPVDVQAEGDDGSLPFADRMADALKALLKSWNMPAEIEALWLEHLAWADREIANLRLVNGALRAELRDFRVVEESPSPENNRPYKASGPREFDPIRLGAPSTRSES